MNAVLTTLSLSVNSIGDAGAEALARALHVNAVLKTLWLSENAIGEKGAEALAGALRVNARINAVLTMLVLIGNNINKNGKKELREAVQGREGFDLSI